MVEKQEKQEKQAAVLVGVDVGSTTTKIAAMDKTNHQLLYSSYDRHHAMQLNSVHTALEKAKEVLQGGKVCLIFTGSGARGIADYLGVPFIQEVVANSIALKKDYSQVRTAIELGGQDAKMIFFRQEKETGALQVTDMRMNGSCAGGTEHLLMRSPHCFELRWRSSMNWQPKERRSMIFPADVECMPRQISSLY